MHADVLIRFGEEILVYILQKSPIELIPEGEESVWENLYIDIDKKSILYSGASPGIFEVLQKTMAWLGGNDWESRLYRHAGKVGSAY